MSATRILRYAFFLLPLSSMAQQPRLVFPAWHNNDVIYGEFSADQKKILTQGEDRLIKIWAADNGKLLQTLPAHEEEVTTAFFNPDSKQVLTASKDSSARLWDIASGKLLLILRGLPRSSPFACFSPDGNMILTSSQEHFALIWNARTGEKINVLELPETRRLEKAVFSYNGQFILASSSDGITCILETATGNRVRSLETEGFLQGAEFSRDGKLVVTELSTQTKQYVIWNVSTGQIMQKIDAGKTSRNPCLHFTGDGKKLMGVTNDSILTVWDVSTGQVLQSFHGNKPRIQSACFSPDDKLVLISSASRTARLWETATGKPVYSLQEGNTGIMRAVFSPDGKKIMLVTLEKPASLWNTGTGEFLYRLSGISTRPVDAMFSPDEKYFFSYSYTLGWMKWDAATGKNVPLPFRTMSPSLDYCKNGRWMYYTDTMFHLWDEKSGKELLSFRPVPDPGKNQFNKGGQWILSGDDGGLSGFTSTTVPGSFQQPPYSISLGPTGIAAKKELRINGETIIDVWDISAYRFLLPNGKRFIYDDIKPFIGDSDKYLVTPSSEEEIKVWDAATGSYIRSLKGHTGWPVFHAEFNNRGDRVVSGGYDRMIIVWDMKEGKLQYTLTGHQDGVQSTRFNKTGSKIISASSDGQVKIWDTGKRAEICSFIKIDSTASFARIPSGYYQCSPDAAKILHYVTMDLRVITFEQLDVKYNRPDKVLEAIGNTDTALIKSYRKAWEKRITKLGIDTTAFRDGYSVPEADVINRDDIEYEQKNGTLRLHIRGIDSAYKLDRFNVWVNESPVFGQRGISIKKKNSNSIDTTITIRLSQGVNRIETSITNINGTESYRMPLYVNFTPPVKQKETTRFIGIGIDRFADSKNNLQYSSKDIRDLAGKLKEKYGDNIIIDTLFNEDVTTEKVKILKQKLQQGSVNDKVIVSYSGHGLLSKEYDYYLSTYSINFDKPEENGLPYDELENLLDSIPARKKLMLIDACHSGEVDKEEIVRITEAEDSLKKQGTKGGKPTYTGKTQVGMKNSFELMQSLFVNVGKSTGATIISAAAGTQFALERGDLKNGVFTYCILEAMDKKPTMKISELKKTVGERVEQLTNGLQKPTSRNETIAVDWSLW